MRSWNLRTALLALIAGMAGIAGIFTQPAPAQGFADNFDGEELTETWSVVNPRRDAHKVVGGNLQLLAKVVTADDDIADGAMSNLLTASVKPPEGDWIMSIRFTADLQTARESLVFGLLDDRDKYVLADIYTDGDSNRGWQLNAAISKRSASSQSRFTDTVAALRCNICGKARTFGKFADSLAMPVDARIVKTGSEFTLEIRLGDSDEDWRRIATVISIHPPAKPVVFARQREEVEGVTAFHVDFFRIDPVQ